MSLEDDLLDQAVTLLSLDARRPKQVNLRRSLSGCYYALFHEVRAGAARLALPGGCSVELRDAFGRAFTHKDLRDGAKTVRDAYLDQKTRRPPGGTLKVATLRLQRAFGGPIGSDTAAVAATPVRLQELRHEADYAISRAFTKGSVLKEIDATRRAIQLHRGLPAVQAGALHLLLRTPTRDLRLG